MEKTALKRNYGIDLLRIVCMIMIPVLHVLGHGGILEGAEVLSARYEVAWFFETAAFCAVNCYALISGYVYYGAKKRYANLMMLYLQVFFYIASISILYAVLRPGKLDIADAMKQALFSFVIEPYWTYWYVKAYFCLFLFMPFLDLILDKFDKITLQRFLFVIFLVCSVLPTVFRSDYVKLDRGYSFVWLAILYLVGAYIKKYGLWNNIKNWTNLLGYFLCVVISWGIKFAVNTVQNNHSIKIPDENYIIRYNSPTIFLCALFLFMFFLNLKIKPQMIKFIKFFAPASFGVYLLHEEPLVRDKLITGTFASYLNMPIWLMVLAVLGTAVLIWLGGSLIDRVRIFFFDLFKIKRCCIRIEDSISKIFNKGSKNTERRY